MRQSPGRLQSAIDQHPPNCVSRRHGGALARRPGLARRKCVGQVLWSLRPREALADRTYVRLGWCRAPRGSGRALENRECAPFAGDAAAGRPRADPRRLDAGARAAGRAPGGPAATLGRGSWGCPPWGAGSRPPLPRSPSRAGTSYSTPASSSLFTALKRAGFGRSGPSKGAGARYWCRFRSQASPAARTVSSRGAMS
jgi:hypothetical protein